MLTRGQKISLTQKRNFKLGITKPTNYWKGKKRSKETKDKIKNKLIGRKLSTTTKEKISISIKKLYKEGKKRKICNTGRTNFKKGNIPWNKNLKGIHLSPDSEFKEGKNCKEKNHNWKGGTTSLNRSIRSTKKNILWRKKIFTRDNYTCQICLKKEEVSKKLQAHHIKELYKIIEENNITTLKEAKDCKELWDVNNGITYCKKCHLEYHGLTKKAVKSGDILTGNAEDNPEPSPKGKVRRSELK